MKIFNEEGRSDQLSDSEIFKWNTNKLINLRIIKHFCLYSKLHFFLAENYSFIFLIGRWSPREKQTWLLPKRFRYGKVLLESRSPEKFSIFSINTCYLMSWNYANRNPFDFFEYSWLEIKNLNFVHIWG